MISYYFAGTGNCRSFSPFLCQPSTDSQVYTPNIPDFYFDIDNVAGFRTAASGANLTTRNEQRVTTIIFSIPPRSPERNCSGTVTALQYCYESTAEFLDRGQRNINIFWLLTLSRNGSRFTVSRRYMARTTPRDSVCVNSSETRRVCCAETARNFQITASTHWFGVTVLGQNRRPLAFADSVTDYEVEQFQVRISNTVPAVDDTLIVDNLLNRPLLLLRFLLGKQSWQKCMVNEIFSIVAAAYSYSWFQSQACPHLN